MDELTKTIINNIAENSPKIVKELEKERLKHMEMFNEEEYKKKIQSLKTHRSTK